MNFEKCISNFQKCDDIRAIMEQDEGKSTKYDAKLFITSYNFAWQTNLRNMILLNLQD